MFFSFLRRRERSAPRPKHIEDEPFHVGHGRYEIRLVDEPVDPGRGGKIGSDAVCDQCHNAVFLFQIRKITGELLRRLPRRRRSVIEAQNVRVGEQRDEMLRLVRASAFTVDVYGGFFSFRDQSLMTALPSNDLYSFSTPRPATHSRVSYVLRFGLAEAYTHDGVGQRQTFGETAS